MRSIRNKVTLIGNLGAKPEIREFESGNKLATFRIATNDYRYNGDGEKVKETHWHRLKAWGKLAENITNLTDTGTEIAVEGRLVTNSFKNKDGEDVNLIEVEVNDFMLLRKKAV
ncbi:MAG: single-stranded DNA-binding protein [Cryomorphaceae bacterium]|nr:single-stranded DNA-binding protein [Cryomorphaceae bacterium]